MLVTSYCIYVAISRRLNLWCDRKHRKRIWILINSMECAFHSVNDPIHIQVSMGHMGNGEYYRERKLIKQNIYFLSLYYAIPVADSIII